MYVLEDAQLVILRTYPPPAKIAESEATKQGQDQHETGGAPPGAYVIPIWPVEGRTLIHELEKCLPQETRGTSPCATLQTFAI